jgi:pyrroline-5-carboxylate reductase
MGLTFARSFLHSHIVTHDRMLILEKSLKKAEELKKLDIGTVYGEPGEYIKDADLIIFAVKPQDTSLLFESIRPFIDEQQVILSIMAGVTMKTISEALNTNKVIRAMPNLPAQVGVGMTAFTSSEAVTRIELVMVQNLLNATGKTIYVETEKAINAATAVSGSGPAYVFYIMQAMIDAAKKMGFSLSEAELLTYQTFRGAIELFNKFDLSCDEWIQKVSSKGGTTEAAFNTFHNDALHLKFQDGLKAAFRRAEELSKDK